MTVPVWVWWLAAGVLAYFLYTRLAHQGTVPIPPGAYWPGMRR